MVKPGYFIGLVKHLLQTAGRDDIVKVETSAEAGAVGYRWGRHGLKVTYADGVAVFLASTRTSPTVAGAEDGPDVFAPEVLDVSRVRR